MVRFVVDLSGRWFGMCCIFCGIRDRPLGMGVHGKKGGIVGPYGVGKG